MFENYVNNLNNDKYILSYLYKVKTILIPMKIQRVVNTKLRMQDYKN